MKKLKAMVAILAIALFAAALCLPSAGCAKDKELILASTTSTQDSGLFDALLPSFEEATGYKVKVIAVGSGEAIELGKKGEADVILVHSRKAEDQFVEGGYGVNRKDVMHNDYLIVGPEEDPAQISRMTLAADAFKAIADSKSLFVSRADDSGTHKKELSIWEKLKITPSEDWYIETGQSMGETLRIADEKQGYTLTDNGTWLAQKENFTLVELVMGDKALYNPYGVIAVNYKKHSNIKINYEGAMAFINWITGPEGQGIIKEFGVEKYGQPLFYPDVIK
ncbi:MAG: tungsten ABC transporter substrate-binding protein [Actinobacteria bacterium]|nr:tungsten ABC transporter substrate-binding protein [Actinomycetota bacterium]